MQHVEHALLFALAVVDLIPVALLVGQSRGFSGLDIAIQPEAGQRRQIVGR